jgi:hypothetical protein
MKKVAAACAMLLVLGACAITQTVKPVSVSGIEAVCIKTNDKVMMSGFLPELQSQVQAKGIKTTTFNGDRPSSCKHHVEYTANWAWDLAMYLTYVEINVFENGLLVGQATYDARGGGGRMDKFGATADKLRPLVDQLFVRRS